MITEDLEKTIKRAISYATDRQHQYATLEHFLLALIDDRDAIEVFKACKINLRNLNYSKIIDPIPHYNFYELLVFIDLKQHKIVKVYEKK